MAFAFVHSADLQIGKPFRSFDERLAGRLEAARIDAIEVLSSAARRAGASHILVAGDIYDSEAVPLKTLRQPLARMARDQDLTWVLLPGNHDPHRPGGIWQRIATIGFPDNVIAALGEEPIMLSREVALLPAPVTARALTNDPTAGMDAAVTGDGVLRIGLAHGSVQGFGSEQSSSITIDPDRWRKAGLSYLALGDWHGMTKVNERTWYSGTPEPDRFPDNAPGYALAVRVQDGSGAPEVSPVKTGQFVWAKANEQLNSLDALPALSRKLLALCEDPSRLLLKLSIGGTMTAEGFADFDLWAADLDARLAHLALDAGGVLLSGNLDDSEVLGASGEIAVAARALQAIASDSGDERSTIAALAVRRLVSITQAARDAQGTREAGR